MKLPVLLIAVLVTFSSLCIPDVKAQGTFKSNFNEGVKHYNSGDYAMALAHFELAVRQNPRSPHARSYVIKSKTAMAKNLGKKNTIEDQMAKIVLPQINFSDAPIGDVLEYLTARAEEISGGQFAPNFIYKGTPEQRQNTLITLSIRNVPMTVAIKYISQLGRTKFSYEEHAVVVDPNYVEPVNKELEAAAKAEEKPGSVFGEPVKNIFE